MFSKSTFLVITIISIAFTSSITLAGQNKTHGSITLQSELTTSDHSDTFLSNDVNVYIANEKVGFGLNTTFAPENDFTKVNPFVTWTVSDASQIIGGFSTNSLENDYFHVGLTYLQKISQNVSIFVDPRLYIGLNDQSEEFLDFFIELGYDYGDDLRLTVEAIYDYTPQSQKSWLLVGPALHYAVNDNFSLFSRISIASDFEEETENFNIRVGCKLTF